MIGYPTVRTDDILVHPRDGDLIVASHGRSLWIADDITPLQQLTPALAQQDVVLFDVRPAIAYAFDYRADPFAGSDKAFEGENPARGTAIHYYLKAPSPDSVKLAIVDVNGRTLCMSNGPSTAGIHRLQWTLVAPLTAAGGRAGRVGGGGALGEGGGGAGNPAPDPGCSGGAGGGRGGGAGNAVAPGNYLVRLTLGTRVLTKVVDVLEDKWLNER